MSGEFLVERIKYICSKASIQKLQPQGGLVPDKKSRCQVMIFELVWTQTDRLFPRIAPVSNSDDDDDDGPPSTAPMAMVDVEDSLEPELLLMGPERLPLPNPMPFPVVAVDTNHSPATSDAGLDDDEEDL